MKFIGVLLDEDLSLKKLLKFAEKSCYEYRVIYKAKPCLSKDPLLELYVFFPSTRTLIMLF